ARWRSSLFPDVGDLAHSGLRRSGIAGEVFLHYRAKPGGIVALGPAESGRGIAIKIVRSRDPVAHRTKIRLVRLVVPDLAHCRGAATAGRMVRSGDRLAVVENHNIGGCGDGRVR